jgi:hypothetical protein
MSMYISLHTKPEHKLVSRVRHIDAEKSHSGEPYTELLLWIGDADITVFCTREQYQEFREQLYNL